MSADIRSVTSSTTPAPTLRELLRAGRVPQCYPDVAPMLRAMDDHERERAGRLLARVSPDAVLAAHPKTPVVAATITGHGTLAALEPALTADLAAHGILLRSQVSPFDSWIADLSDPVGRGLTDSDLVLCVLDPTVVTDELPQPWRVDDAERVLTEKIRLIRGLAERFSGATLVLNTLPLPATMTGQLIDLRSRARLGALWRSANADLLALPERHPGVVVLDLDPILADGVPATDARLSVYGGAHLSGPLLARYAREVGALARLIAGRQRKCLVLDLDQTLWGGVLGDDGAEGIEVDGGHRGAAFTAFQRVVQQLGSQGVLLATASKNSLAAVTAVLRDHPGMTLRESDFVRVHADWQPKSAAISQLAADLNLGRDSLVFVDDSPFECGQVGAELPEVAVVQLDDEPARHVEKLLRGGWFTVRELTSEDRTRTEKYRQEIRRGEYLGSATSFEDYLRGLDLVVRLAPVAERDLPRLSQLTLRTNQFNLTTRRMQELDVRRLMEEPGGLALAVHSADRFGENGLVGAILLRRAADAWHIVNFLLSCRVFSRGIEQAALAAVLRAARASETGGVTAEFRRSAKNGIVSEFYPRHGFRQQERPDGGDVAFYRHDLAELLAHPAHIRLLDGLGGNEDFTES
ncbi:HAD-IIIC family phosphatase [Micromonospora lupini]|uniref:HAD-IIIC family phosphatase n=1 Tax=Micromonospora lupini TaxID=285679 RepID=UPI00340AEB76